MDDTWPTSVNRALTDLANPVVVELALKGAAREIAFLRRQIRVLETGRTERFSEGPELVDPPKSVPTAVNARRKAYRDRTFWSGLSAHQAFRVEVACLTRLSRGPAACHFPTLVDVDARTPSVRLADAGCDLAALARAGRRVAVPDAAGQIEGILAALAAARVVHLDLHRTGKNLCVDATGRITLIDFDQAALDGRTWSGLCEDRLAQIGRDPVAWQRRRLHEILSRFKVLARA